MTRALITRPIDDAKPLADALAKRGIEPVIEPLLSVTPLPDALPALDGVGALLFTSANGVRAFARASERRDLAALTVGPSSATAARAAGFATVESADGDVEALAKLVIARRKPDDGKLLHVAGRTVAGDLAGQLAPHGFTVERVALYDAVPATALRPAVADDLAGGRIDWVLLFSPRTAATFARLIGEAKRSDALKRCTAICLSPAVAEAVARLPWQRVRVATKPDQDSLLAAIDALQAELAVPRQAPAPRRAAVWPAIAAASATVLVLAAALGASAPLWRDWVLPPPAAPAPDTARLDALGARVDQLQRAAAAPRPAPATDAALDQRVAALSRELDGLRATVADGAARGDQPALAALDARLAKLADQLAALQQHTAQLDQAQEQRRDETARDAAFALSVAALDSAARAGRPFAANLAALRRTMPDPATAALLAPLEPLAADGVATLERLKRDWPVAARAAQAAQVAAQYHGWLGTVMAFVEGLVTIRRVGADVTGDDAEALLARAGARLDADDLAGAVALVERLPEPAAHAAAPWLTRARARLTAEAALGRLVERALGASAKG